MKRKLLSLFISVAIILPLLALYVDSATGTIYESELNDVYSSSNQTYNDYNNYGQITSQNDIDWWHITPTQTGLANIYLSVPSGSDYDLYVYDSNATKILAMSINDTPGQFELIRCHLKSTSTYKIKIVSTDNFVNDAYYQMRVKIYPNTGSSLFNAFQNAPTNSLSDFAANCMPALSGLGLLAAEYTHNYPINVLEELPTSDVLVLYSHNNSAGIVKMEPNSNGNTYLTGINHSSMTTGSYSIASLSASSLSQTDLVIYAGSRTGKTGAIYGNLVDQTISKGAFCSLGWTGDVDDTDMMHWLESFFYQCDGDNAYDAADDADYLSYLYSYVDRASLQTRYWGTSNPESLYLDVNQ